MPCSISTTPDPMSTPPPTPPQKPKVFKPPALGQAILVDGHHYFIGEPLGSGSFGQVFACQDEWANQLVAKILVPRNQTYDQVRERWLEELKNCSRSGIPTLPMSTKHSNSMTLSTS